MTVCGGVYGKLGRSRRDWMDHGGYTVYCGRKRKLLTVKVIRK